MPDPILKSEPADDSSESFRDILNQYEQSRARKPAGNDQPLQGRVVAITNDSVILDVGFKTEGILPLVAFQSANETIKVGDRLPVTIKGRNPEGYYELSRGKVRRLTDWAALEKAFADKTTILGTVTAV